MPPGAGLNLFFDVDFTLISFDGDLRPGTRQTFERLVLDGHRIFIWSGVGIRANEVRTHELEGFITGMFVKPIQDFDTALATFGVLVRPDLVIDDSQEIVTNFGGVVVRPYFFPSDDDAEMDLIYRIVSDFAKTGHSEHPSFRPSRG